MKTVADVMTRDVEVVSPEDTIQHAAKLMDELNVGAIPICTDGKRLVGIITDRDITVRATAYGKLPSQTSVSEAMTDQLRFCSEDQSVEEVQRMMSEAQIRRIPVIDSHHKLVGIVALGDLAENKDNDVGETLRLVSTPSEPDRSSIGLSS